jgi:putative aldouronate transport system substrate-binding protein
MRRIIAVALVASLLPLAALFAGGKTESTGASTTGTTSTTASGQSTWEYQNDTSPFEFTVWWPGVWSWAKGAVQAGWDDSPVYTYITKLTGGKMKVDMPAGTENDLAGAMIASGTYPDVVVFGSYRSTYIPQMINAGIVYSWNELIDKYAPKMWNVIPTSQLAFHGDANGKLWYYAGFEYHANWAAESKAMGNIAAAGGAHGTNIMFARKDILTAFGKTDITNLDDFTEYLKFVKKNNPDVDPLHLFVGDPRGSLFTHFKSTFGCDLSLTYPQADGTVKHFMKDPRYVDYLKWLNGLYRGGVITANQLTYDQSAMDTKFYSAGYGAIMSATYVAYNTLEQTIKKNLGDSTDKVYQAIGPIQKTGIPWKAMYLRSKGSQATLITKNAKKADRIIKFYEYLFTKEGQMTINAGVQGADWNYGADGKLVVHNADKAALCSKDLEAYVTKYKLNGNWAPWCNTSYWEGLLGAILTPAGRAVDENNKRLGPDFVTDIWSKGFADITFAVEVGSDVDVINTKVNDVCKTAAMKMIAAGSDADFNSLYSKCLSDIEALGVKKVEDVYTAEHAKQMKALGLSK